jgi:hypothetical protein
VICDGCGKERRPYRTANVYVGGEIDDVFQFCFLCVKEDERREAREMKREARAMRLALSDHGNEGRP